MDTTHEIVITPNRGAMFLQMRELWKYRELLFFLSWRDIKVKYKQSILGIAWVIFRPVASMVIFSVLFGRIAKFPSEGVPYPVFVFLGLLPWTYFSSALTATTGSLVSGTNLISKVYFPRIIIPASASFSNLLDFFVSLVFLVFMMAYYRITPTAGIALIPLLILALVLTALGFGMLFGALNVRFRDVGQAIPFVVQIWMFLTPVIYPLTMIPENYRFLLYLNPLCGIIEAFRAVILGHHAIPLAGLLLSLASCLGIFLCGLLYFRKVERSFADII